MQTYEITPGQMRTFGVPAHDFLTFDQYVNVVQWYRDLYYATDSIPGFARDIGVRYRIWTRRTSCTYHRHIFFDQTRRPVTIGFSIPHLQHRATFPIRAVLFDADGLYYEHEQEIAVEHRVGEGFRLTSWSKVPPLADYLTSAVVQLPKAA